MEVGKSESVLGGVLMLEPERHQIILDALKVKSTVKLQELVELTNSSESTIRRDLIQLEQGKFLKEYMEVLLGYKESYKNQV